MSDSMHEVSDNDVAIIGMAIRVPGASTPEQYWQNLVEGREAVRHYSEDELVAKGVSRGTLADPNYVRTGIQLENLENFDPEFFGFSQKEAAIIDPQHRQFYETSWEAIERAGHPPDRFDGAIGVFAGCGMGAYFTFNLLTNAELMDSVGMFLLRHTGNDKDFLSTRVSYLFDLKGPSVNVQTACSTSLVATHVAVQSLLAGECDIALAGGSTIEVPHGVGYHYREGEVLSPDGHCRPFDHRSKGTVFGSGTGVVVLRRLADAIEDGDHIHAVIKGSAVNNDGSGKVGYLAPSVEGQSAAIAEALAAADVSADTLTYVECHGTATPVGDPIEIAALTNAFRETSDRIAYCRIGSVKSNIGHLDTAAGVASLIKATLALENRKIPPSLNFEAPNPNIAFDGSPFVVASELADWASDTGPRRAGVNSLGVGGTNAFVVLEESPATVPAAQPKSPHFLLISARNRKALDAGSQRLATWLRENPRQPLEDISYTLARGRQRFEHRRVVACSDGVEAAELLEQSDARRVFSSTSEVTRPRVVFMFPGGGAQYFQMGRGLYENEPLFREHMDRGLALLKSRYDVDLADIFHAADSAREVVTQALDRPSNQLPLTFLIEYALTQLWGHYGITPDLMIGHSMGENTAACVAGVTSFEDALGMLLLRGQLVEQAPGGVLSVAMPASELETYLGDSLDLASVNSNQLCVASGTHEMLDDLAQRLAADGIDSQKVKVGVAAHSRLLDGILGQFRERLETTTLGPPKIPIISNRTGEPLTSEQAQDPDYWVQHLRHTVFFGKGIEFLLEHEDLVFIEVGPGNMLSSFVRQNPKAPVQRVLASMRHANDETPDDVYLRTAMGRALASNIELESESVWSSHRITPLPTYPFQHSKYWIEPGEAQANTADDDLRPMRLTDQSKWFVEPGWVQQGIREVDDEPCKWLVFHSQDPLSLSVVNQLRERGNTVVEVQDGDVFARIDDTTFRVAPEAGGDGYQMLVDALAEQELLPDRILHSWLITRDQSHRPGSTFFHRIQNYGFYSLFYFTRALAKAGLEDHRCHVVVVANNSQRVADEELRYPTKATALGACMVIPREFPNISCCFVDLELAEAGTHGNAILQGGAVSDLEQEVLAKADNQVVAWRNGVRWQRHLRPVPPGEALSDTQVRQGGVYLITGGLGGIGSVIANWLAEEFNAKLVLLGRTPLPDRGDWDDWLDHHPVDDSIGRSIEQIRHLEALGAEVLALQADVTVAEQLHEAVVASEDRFGTINGVLHAAGTINDSLIQLKTPREIEEVFSAKLYGTLVLDQEFKARSPDFVILFGSTSAFVAPQGQIDYVGANSFLNAFAQSCAGERKFPVIALNWGIWSDAGRVAPATASRRHSAVQLPAHSSGFSGHASYREGTDEIHELTTSLSAESDWVVDEHRLNSGDALLPGTGYFELIQAALKEIGVDQPLRVTNLMFLAPLFVPDGTTRRVVTKLRSNALGWNVEIECHAIGADTDADVWERCATAQAVVGEIEPRKSLNIAETSARCNGSETTAGGSGALKTRQEDHLRFGPRWRVLKNLRLGAGEALARIQLPAEFESDLENHSIHPAMLDIATGCAMDLIPGYKDQEVAESLWVPVSYRSFTAYAPIEATMYSWIRFRSDSDPNKFAIFDATLTNENGDVIVEVEHLTLSKLEGEFAGPQIATHQASVETDNGTSSRGNLTPGEIALQHNVAQGIDAVSGVDALATVLKRPLQPQLIVSSMDVGDLIAQANLVSQVSLSQSSNRFERPELDNDFEAPRDEIEGTLADLWGTLLGVEGVGIHDSFFDLGGHSLIAVRLFNEVADKFGTDLPMSVLMQSPTIEGLGELIRGTAFDPEQTGEAAEAKPAQRVEPKFRYIVPMNTGPVGGRTPLFVVAGMFGNVLNLSHLAHLLGEDRPFYALQARGLYGDMEPHESFEDMATDYIEEIRQIQPKGPYLLGGFSGGGLIAYEIAHQLLEVGEEVIRVVMLDTPVRELPVLSIADKFAMAFQDFRRTGPRSIIDKVRGRIEWKRSQAALQAEASAEEQSEDVQFMSRTIGDAFLRALRKYQVPTAPLDVCVFRPRQIAKYHLSGGRLMDHDREYLAEDNGWTPYVRKLEVVVVPGNHDNMVLEPNVRVLVGAIRSALTDLDPASTSAAEDELLAD